MLNTIITITNYKWSNLGIEYHSMWLAPHWHNQLLLLLCTAYHSYGQDLDDIARAKRIIFHLYNPKDIGEIAILHLSLCI